MAHIASDALHNLILHNPTSLEIDFMLYILQYQDADSCIRGMYYKDVMKALGCCKQSFYNALYGLRDKNIIRIDRESIIDYDITLLTGDNSIEHAKEVGYLQVRLPVLHSPAFQKLPAYAKMIAMDLMLIVRANNNAWKINKSNFLKRYADTKLLPVKLQPKTLRYYIKLLGDIFYIHKTVNGNLTFALRSFKADPKNVLNQKTDNQLWTENIIKVLCRRHKAIYSNRKFRDTAALLLQYRDIAFSLKKSICKIMSEAFYRSISYTNNILEPFIIHNNIKQLLYSS